MKTIVLNPEEAQRLDYYEHYWKDLMSFEDYLSMKAQQTVFESNEKGYERNPVNSQGLRYVNEEVGYVDEDEEYY
jgi:hypothetical protein